MKPIEKLNNMAELLIYSISETNNFIEIEGTANDKKITHKFHIEFEFLVSGDFSKYLNKDGSPKDELIVKDIFSGLIKIRII